MTETARQTLVAAAMHGIPASVPASGNVTSNLIFTLGMQLAAIGVTSSQTGLITVQRYLDDAGLIKQGAALTQALAAATPAVLNITDGNPFASFTREHQQQRGQHGQPHESRHPPAGQVGGMAFVPYLAADEYAGYGVPDANSSQVDSACRVVNTHLARPEGLVWSPDANGAPAYMTNMSPSRSLAVPAAINPGLNVVVALPGGPFGQQYVGEVVILDRADNAKAEACVITAANGQTVTLESVQISHSAQATMDFGLTILQELPVPANRSTVRLSRTPVARIISGLRPLRGRQAFAAVLRA